MAHAVQHWPRIAVVGAGAVGCYFGGMLARAGAPVTLIGRPPHVEAINGNGLFLDSLKFQERIPIAAATDLEAVREAELVLLCVKTLDTETTAAALAPHRAPESVVVSLQNGVDNVERIRAAAGIDAVAAVVYVSAEMSGPGAVKHNGRGDLVIGDLPGRGGGPRQSTLELIAQTFERAGIPCRVSDNVQAELWTKLLINCAYNAISALGRARYARIGQSPWTRELMVQTIEETLAVAQADGVQFPDRDYVELGLSIAQSMAGALSSTAQDIARGKRTEIDSLNGYVARRGAELGVPTPVNQTLHALIKLLEESGAASQAG
jgi:2-dehydropantoate 2-reductase